MPTCNIKFIPVTVNRGRKFRGFAYDVGAGTTIGMYNTISIKLWEPKEHTYVYANVDFCEYFEADPNPQQTAIDKDTYLKNLLDNQLNWCREKKPNSPDSEIRQFARNCLKKQHPELLEWINQVLPDERDIVQDIENTIKWGLQLKTRECYMYGHHCPGGKPLSDKRKAEIIMASLKKRGITSKPEFPQIWEFMRLQYNLPKN